MLDPDLTQPTTKPGTSLPPGATPTGYQRTTGGKSVRWSPPSPEKLAELLPQYHIEALIGRGGMGAFVPVIDCCSREVLGWELAHTACAKTAERALEEALLHRFGTTRGVPAGLTLRHDNGLIFGSRASRALVRNN